MIRQQVNLLAPMFRKQRAVFSSRITLLIFGIVAAALALIYAGSAWHAASLAAQEAQLTVQRDTANRRLNELAQQMQAQSRDKSLDAQLTALAAERDRKVQTLAALSQREFGNTTGFSPQFIGLARERLNGLWLTRIEVSGHAIALDGVTLSEELIPKYLQKLGSESVFSGTEFSHATLSRAHEGGNQIQFELHTRVASSRGGTP
jgi:MSHA biogenesis protein MshI